MSKRNIGILMDPIADIKPAKDTSLALLIAAQKRDYVLHYIERGQLFLRDDRVYAISHKITVMDDTQQWFQLEEPETLDLGVLDALFMRLDPPFNMSYIFSTHMLELAQKRSDIRVINDPVSLRNYNEKLFITDFPKYCPPMVVSTQPEQLREFIHVQGDTILKPLDGMAGQSIFRIRKDDPNTGVILETMLQRGLPIMAQKYLPEIKQGDKRVNLINGEPIDYVLARIPTKGETRANLAAGGKPEVRELSKRDREIACGVGAHMMDLGIVLAGLDIIGDYLTEINITSPTGVREVEYATGEDISGKIVEAAMAGTVS
jgi:glutathione synthase